MVDDNALTPDEVLAVGYADATIEMSPTDFYGGIFWADTNFKGTFENDPTDN